MSLLRRKVWSFLGRRKKTLYMPLLASSLLILVLCWGLLRNSLLSSWPDRVEANLAHFRRSRSLGHYLDHIRLLIEPSSPPGANVEEIKVIALVASAPTHFEARAAIRNTWGVHLPTFFVMGLETSGPDEQLIQNYMEAKQYSDLVVYDFPDHYQNLTIKTALMMQWTLQRCPQAEFILKVDDDVLVNPWVLKEVLTENEDAKLIGYVHKQRPVYRQPYSKWYLPRWLHSDDIVPEFLAGPAYLINGGNIRNLLETAHKVPMINIEDVFYTHLVASTLHYRLTHDPRVTPRRPWPAFLPVACAYWQQATVHSVTPYEMDWIWAKVRDIGTEFESNEDVCRGVLVRFVLKFVYWY